MQANKLIFAFAFSSMAGASGAQKPVKPNIVFVYLDDLGYGDLSCYGATKLQTPNIDQLAKAGLRFTDAHASAATSTPSRYSLLTGTYAFRANAGIQKGDAPMLIAESTPTIAQMLQKQGYRTAVIGKWHLGLGDGNVDWNGKIAPGPLERGFDYSYLIPATGDRVPCVIVENHHVVGLDPADPILVNYDQKVGNDPTGKENPELNKFKADPQHSNTIINGVSRIGWMSGGNAARWKDETVPYQMLHKTREFIQENQKQPFFIYFSLHDVHVPRLPDYRFQGATELGVYGDVIVQMDWITGQLVDYLKKTGVYENTMIIFTSDNGPVKNDGYDDQSAELLAKHNHQPAGPFRGGKYSAFEGGSRVPTIISWPAMICPGESKALISQVDFYASLASLVGHTLSDNEAPDSRNVINALLGRSQEGRQSLLKESHTFTLRRGNYKYIQPVKNFKASAWIDNGKKIESGASLKPQLYDLAVDPGERVNLATSMPELVSEMQKELDRVTATGSR
jgi:arylsulfatase A